MAETSDEKLLFTPGPLCVTKAVKSEMLRDYGSRDSAFLQIVTELREKLPVIAGAPVLKPEERATSEEQYDAILLQGSGSYAVEAVFATAVPKANGKVLVIINGSYGRRIALMCEYNNIPHIILDYGEDSLPNLAEVRETLVKNPDLTHVAVIHSETTSGLLNPITELGHMIKEVIPTAQFVVDAMSSFGGYPINVIESKVDYLVASANKCLQGVPGFAYVIARRQALYKYKGNARNLSLDIIAQLEGFEKNSQFRFTPPTHTLAALAKALEELEAEGGVEGRYKRYRTNQAISRIGFERLGFKQFLPVEIQGPFITSYNFLPHPNWNFETFYTKLNTRNCILYPGKMTKADSFRVGNIGNLFPKDIKYLVAQSAEVLVEMGILTQDQITWTDRKSVV